MDDYVSFEIAKKLKEKGFPQHWSDQHYILENEYEDDFFEVGAKYPVEVIYDYIPTIAAPTISQVLKWLREKYFIHISTKPYPCEDGIMWLYEIRKFSAYISIVVANKTGFIKEEQAALAGIEYVLDNLI